MEMAETKWEQSSRESGTGCYVILMSPPMFDHVMVLLQTSVPMTLLLLLTNNAKMAQPMFDLIVSNPPYIALGEIAGLEPEVRLWEPRQALTDGGDGLDAYRAIVEGLSGALKPEGRARILSRRQRAPVRSRSARS